jgi:hypothetical protein
MEVTSYPTYEFKSMFKLCKEKITISVTILHMYLSHVRFITHIKQLNQTAYSNYRMIVSKIFIWRQIYYARQKRDILFAA